LSQAPPFTLSDLREAIPDKCWEKDAFKSFSYLVKDVAIVLGLAAGAYFLDSW
jgi:acyl-lipid omega-3 desaturase